MYDLLLTIPWWGYCLVLVVGTAAFGIVMRFIDESLYPSLFGLYFNGLATVILAIMVAGFVASGLELSWTPFSLGMGVILGLGFVGVDRSVIAMYRRGAPVSLGMPIVRIGNAVGAALIGLLFFAEILSVAKAAGIFIGCTGIYLALQKK